MAQTRIIILSSIYFIIGFVILFYDTSAGILYFTVFPIHFLFVYKSIKWGNYCLSLVFLLLLLSQGVNSFLFFLNRDKYSAIGFKAVGSFEFILADYLGSYFYIFCFSVVLFFFSFLLSKTKTNVFNAIGDKTTTFSSDKKASSLYMYLSIILCAIAIVLSIIMYTNQLGILGLNQKQLPFHLTGILYYFRRFVIAGLLIFFYAKSKNRNIALLFIVLYAFIYSFASVSRSGVAILLMPLAALDLIQKNVKRAVVIIFIYSILFCILSKKRN